VSGACPCKLSNIIWLRDSHGNSGRTSVECLWSKKRFASSLDRRRPTAPLRGRSNCSPSRSSRFARSRWPNKSDGPRTPNPDLHITCIPAALLLALALVESLLLGFVGAQSLAAAA
jgi:hypothetical protein